MKNDIIQAYLWYDVIRLGFSPGTKNIKSWLLMYGKSLKDFWGIAEYPPTPKSNGSIIAELTSFIEINMLIEYSIADISNYSMRFLHINNTRDLMWIHDVDGAYFMFPERSFLSKYGKGKEAIKKISANHIEKVLDGLIFHPTAHQHIESPINHHKIRIGGGILNPFIFLFHLRYQLCPDEARRDEEKKRLIKLFGSAVKSGIPVTTNDLLSAT